MLLVTLLLGLALGLPDLEAMLDWTGIVLLSGGVAALALVRLPRFRRLAPWLGLLVVEELVVIALAIGPYPFAPERAARYGAFLTTGILLGGLLLARVPLPEQCMPLRGRWLRMLLAAVCLVCLVLAGPWQPAVEQYAWVSMPRPLLLAGAPVGLLLLHSGWRVLVTGLELRWRPLRRRAAAP
jgi:hypothetical protein